MAQIVDQYVIDTTQFQAEVEKVLAKYGLVEKSADKAGKAGAEGAKQATTEVKKLEKETGSLEGSFKKLGTAMAAAFAVGKIKQFLESSVEAANVQLQAEAKLLQALKGRGDVMDRLTARASELQKQTLFGDEAIIQQQAFLAAQGRTEEEINRTIDAAIQLSAVTGDDLGTAVKNLDATLEGNVGRLGKLDGAFKELTAEQLKNGGAIDLISEKYQGFAETQAQTGTGAVIRLKNAFGDFMEEIGKRLIPVIQQVSNVFISLLSNQEGIFAMLSNVFTPIIDNYKKAWKGIVDIFKTLFPEGSKAQGVIDGIGTAFKIAVAPTRILAEIVAGVVKVLKAVALQFKSASESSSFLGKAFGILIIPLKTVFNLFLDLPNVIVGTIKAVTEFASSVVSLDFVNIFQRTGAAFKSAFNTSSQQSEIDKLRKSLESLTDDEKIKRLLAMKKAFQGNEIAIKMIDAELLKLKATTATTTADYVDKVKERTDAERQYLKERLAIARKIEDLENQLIGDENERAKKQTQVKFARLREDAEAELKDKKITFAEFSRLNDLYFKMEQAETKKHNTEMAKKRDELFAQNLAEQLKAEAEKAKARADFLKKYTIPTLEDLFDEESAALGDALANNLISYEEYYAILTQMDEKYAAKKKKIEEDAAAETLQNMQKAVGLASTGIKDIIAGLGGTQGEYAEFTKALAIFDIAMNQGVAIAAAIAGATAAASAKGPAAPFVVAGYIASMVGAVVAGFGQISALTAAEPPKFFEGTDFVPLGGNKRGKDTVPALLNEGEAVIPTDQNAEYPGMAKAWLNNDLSPYIHRNFVAPALKRQREEMQMRQWKEMGSAMVANFDDYRLHRDLNEQTGVLRSGFASLKEGRAKIRGRG
jgi:hypothetical protein